LKAYVGAALIFLLLASGFSGFTSLVNAENSDTPVLSMPVEYVNYTIVDVNGALWAKVDGTYPIHILNFKNASTSFPMFYPIPPGTKNISWALNGTSLSWSDYSTDMHHTAIGNWKMVAFQVDWATDFFVLTTHYEHPLQTVNGSFLFLYDLNINPYLSGEEENSDIYYNVSFDVNATNIKAFTTQTDTNWVPINYNSTQNGAKQAISIVQHSKYEAVLGDLVVEFSASGFVDEFSGWVLLPVVFAVLGAALLYRKVNVNKPKNQN
jgi:hypothetical protein